MPSTPGSFVFTGDCAELRFGHGEKFLVAVLSGRNIPHVYVGRKYLTEEVFRESPIHQEIQEELTVCSGLDESLKDARALEQFVPRTSCYGSMEKCLDVLDQFVLILSEEKMTEKVSVTRSGVREQVRKLVLAENKPILFPIHGSGHDVLEPYDFASGHVYSL
jgi:hypothetical protein